MTFTIVCKNEVATYDACNIHTDTIKIDFNELFITLIPLACNCSVFHPFKKDRTNISGLYVHSIFKRKSANDISDNVVALS